MAVEKLSISIPGAALEFVERYRKKHSIKTRSEVVQEALALLRERELEGAYGESSAEIDLDWDCLSSDGLIDEAW
ncbi:MAG: hypothetical protein ABIQ03_02255 [Burkholderiales bacterium]